MRRLARGETLALVAPLVVGVLVAVAWRALLPTSRELGDEQEIQSAVDGTLGGLGLLVGLLIGVAPLVWPGRTPVRRVLAVMITSTIGAVISWQLGDRLDNPELQLRAIGAAFLWPATTAVVIMIGAIMPWTSARLEASARPDLHD